MRKRIVVAGERDVCIFFNTKLVLCMSNVSSKKEDHVACKVVMSHDCHRERALAKYNEMDEEVISFCI